MESLISYTARGWYYTVEIQRRNDTIIFKIGTNWLVHTFLESQKLQLDFVLFCFVFLSHQSLVHNCNVVYGFMY